MSNEPRPRSITDCIKAAYAHVREHNDRVLYYLLTGDSSVLPPRRQGGLQEAILQDGRPDHTADEVPNQRRRDART